MLIICEDCGKKYRLDHTILKPKPVKFKCKTCDHLIMLPGAQNTGGDPDDVTQAPPASNDGRENKGECIEDLGMGASMCDAVSAEADNPLPADPHAVPALLSLRSKMLFLFVVLPVILFASSAVLFFYQTVRLEHSLTGESTAIITRMAEAKITHLEESTRPVATLEARSKSLTGRIKTTMAIVLGGTLLAIGVTVSIFAHRLTARIRSLTDAADRISIGDVEVEIPVCSRDEFGKLAEAISRMQDSIRLSIERLSPS